MHVPFETMTADNLLEAINKVLNDPKYTNEVRRRGQLLLDEVNKIKKLKPVGRSSKIKVQVDLVIFE